MHGKNSEDICPFARWLLVDCIIKCSGEKILFFYVCWMVAGILCAFASVMGAQLGIKFKQFILKSVVVRGKQYSNCCINIIKYWLIRVEATSAVTDRQYSDLSTIRSRYFAHYFWTLPLDLKPERNFPRVSSCNASKNSQPYPLTLNSRGISWP